MKIIMVAAALALAGCTADQLSPPNNVFDDFASRMTEYDGWTLASAETADWLNVSTRNATE